MAKFPRARAWPRILLYIALIIVLTLGGIVWFDVLGLIDARAFFRPVLSLVGLAPRATPVPQESEFLLDSMRIQKLDESVNLRIAQLEQNREDLAQEREVFQQQLSELEEREEAQQDREKSFNDRLQEYDNRRANLIRISEDLTSMRPDDAVAILIGYDDQLLIDTLRVTQELADQAGELSLVSVWLSRMPPDRAADIQRKMAIKPPS
ncbi:periplasmic-type flagellar collar protein FlbB [Spirochaeta lutea]|uniref:Flagellar protein FlbB n=1 Tax=Spirochaeta lutea TaxID=1480694 RepID=A0A098R172_9SPIO|nr:hypothetical protein [Spirochaeta lutea]KGE73526.1 hypothetical protein DC28_02350 [Spirochaeta lutea]